MTPGPPRSTLFPYPTLFRSPGILDRPRDAVDVRHRHRRPAGRAQRVVHPLDDAAGRLPRMGVEGADREPRRLGGIGPDRKSTRLNPVTATPRMPASA